jgi:hypothetical protein
MHISPYTRYSSHYQVTVEVEVELGTRVCATVGDAYCGEMKVVKYFPGR